MGRKGWLENIAGHGLATAGWSCEAAAQPHTVHQHGVRRLRDALRSQILHGDFPGGLLPSEAELMAGHGTTRGVVREALTLLRQERLIERTQGVGTYAVRSATHTTLTEMHGVTESGGLLDTGMRPRILDRSVVQATPTVARRLGVEPGTPCLRYEYVAMIGEEPIGGHQLRAVPRGGTAARRAVPHPLVPAA